MNLHQKLPLGLAVIFVLGTLALVSVGCQDTQDAIAKRSASSDASNSDFAHSNWHATGGSAEAPPATQP